MIWVHVSVKTLCSTLAEVLTPLTRPFFFFSSSVVSQTSKEAQRK